MANPLVCLQSQSCGYRSLQTLNIKMDENLAKKSGLSHVRTSVIVIRSAFLEPQKRRKYAKNVGVNRSEIPKTDILVTRPNWCKNYKLEIQHFFV